jgi:hypothetical protein
LVESKVGRCKSEIVYNDIFYPFCINIFVPSIINLPLVRKIEKR